MSGAARILHNNPDEAQSAVQFHTFASFVASRSPWAFSAGILLGASALDSLAHLRHGRG